MYPSERSAKRCVSRLGRVSPVSPISHVSHVSRRAAVTFTRGSQLGRPHAADGWSSSPAAQRHQGDGQEKGFHSRSPGYLADIPTAYPLTSDGEQAPPS